MTTTLTAVEMRLELIHIPVTDVDRARDFYVQQCGWELITDHVQMGDMRIVQIVPPGSGCAILMGRNIPEITDMPVGVAEGHPPRGAPTCSRPRPARRQRRRAGRDAGPRRRALLPLRRTPTATRGCSSSGPYGGMTDDLVTTIALRCAGARDPLSLVFAALADPTRRAILARLKGGPVTVGELGRPFEMTGPAVSKHLRVLERAGLVSRSRVAQARPAILEAGPLEAVAEWAEEFRQFWDERFDRLDDYLATMTDPDLPTEDDA